MTRPITVIGTSAQFRVYAPLSTTTE